jgi:hypothetical protein
MSATSTRDQVTRLAPADPEGAAQVARSIDEPWFRAQALAWAARFAADDRVVPLAEEALRSSYAETDAYRTVATAAWPLRALVERGQSNKARSTLDRLLLLAPQVEPPASRAEALFLIWQAIFPLDADARVRVLDVLLQSCRMEDSWRVGRVFQDVAAMLPKDERTVVGRILAVMPEGRWKRQARRRIAGSDRPGPRPFFWFAG